MTLFCINIKPAEQIETLHVSWQHVPKVFCVHWSCWYCRVTEW